MGAREGHESDGGFGVALCFGGEDEVDGVGLGFEAGGKVVAVAGVFAVVDAGVGCQFCGWEGEVLARGR